MKQPTVRVFKDEQEGSTRVDLHVMLQLRVKRETLSAGQTGVWCLARVEPHVDFTVRVPAEGLPTEGAGEGLLARVAPHMDGEAAAVHEGFATGGAAVPPLVSVLVLACVEVHVGLAVAVAAEASPADLAGEGSLSGMAPHVDDQVVPGGELLVADGAAVLQLVEVGAADRVDLGVAHQEGIVREGFPADRAINRSIGRTRFVRTQIVRLLCSESL